LIAIFSFALLSSADLSAREWTAKTGHKITGDFVSFEDGIVRIAQSNGSVARVPLDQLSEEDQKFVETQKKSPFVIEEKQTSPFTIEKKKTEEIKLVKFFARRHQVQRRSPFSFDVLKIALFHTLGKLPEPNFTHRFW
jgi:hypothetical protein